MLAQNRIGFVLAERMVGGVFTHKHFAGLAGNQAAMAVSRAFGGYGEGANGYTAVVSMLVIVYLANLVSAWTLSRSTLKVSKDLKNS